MIFNDRGHDTIKKEFVDFWNRLKRIVPDGAEKTLVMRKLQEGYHYACDAKVNDKEYNKMAKPKDEHLNNGNRVLNYNR